MTYAWPRGTSSACAGASAPMPKPVWSMASLSRTGGHQPTAVSEALVEAGSTWWEAGTPDICSISELLLWFSPELGQARDMEMDKTARFCDRELKVRADVSLDSDSPEESWPGWRRHRQRGEGWVGEDPEGNGRPKKLPNSAWVGGKEGQGDFPREKEAQIATCRRAWN